MRLSDLLSGLPIEELLVPDETGVLVASHTPPDLDILDISDDSRRITPNSLFVALPGQTHDGHQFAADVVKRGAVALLVQRPCPVPVPQIRVQHTPRVLSLLAANFYRRPAESLSLLAVTGTNGKTTTTHLVQGLLEYAEVPTGLIGTNGYRFHNHTWPAPFTTPTSLLLQKTLAEMHAQGAKAVVMEASSHALALSRLVGVRFRVAAFANLTQDHLDFHRDMEDYFAAKSLLFTQHLLRALRTPSLKVEDVFKQVRLNVMKDSSNQQVPWDSSSLTGDFYFLPPTRTAREPAPPPGGPHGLDSKGTTPFPILPRPSCFSPPGCVRSLSCAS